MKKAELTDTLAFQLKATGKRDFVREHRFHPTRMWRFDIAFVAVRLGIECQGGIYGRGRHSRGAGQEGDYEKHNSAVLLGWTVLYFGPTTVKDGNALLVIEQALTGLESFSTTTGD